MNKSSNWINFYILGSFILLLLLFAFASGKADANEAFAQYPGFSDPGARTAGGAAGGIVPVEDLVDGGTIPIGATAQVVIRFRNEGSQPVETGLIRLYPSSTVSAQVSLNQCQESPLVSGAECAVAISVKGLQAGQWRVEMLMSHSGRTRLVATTLSGTVESSGDQSSDLTTDVETIPDDLDFGSLEDSQTLVEPVVLRNVTSAAIDITDMYIDTSTQAGYTFKSECERLEAGQSCIAVISWSPKLRGRSSGVFVIEHTGPAGLTSVPLKGEYDPSDVDEAEVFPQAVPGKGLLVSSQTEINFGSDVETASTITVSLVNAGDAPLTLRDIRISGSDNGLSFKDDGCVRETVLEPIEACPLTITWSPTRIGGLFDDVQILHNGARGVLVLPIRGDAIAAVSQDQRAIVLNQGTTIVSEVPDGAREGADDDEDEESEREPRREERRNISYTPSNVNPVSVLDGYKITSFSPTRAIINGPGGSRIVFDNEEIVLGGIPWFVVIQKNGIEFLHRGQRVLLLFDRSLSSINRTGSSSSSRSGSGGSSSSSSTTILDDNG